MGKDSNSPLVLCEKGRARSSPFEQECCGRIWTKQSDFKRHSATHDPNAKHVCQYEGCGKSFNQKTALKTHVNTHIGARPHKCRMDKCTADFSDPSSRGRHEREVHDPSFGYQCKNCPYTTKRREQFAKHWDECVGSKISKVDYTEAQKAHHAAYMELVKKGERPAPPTRPRVYKPRPDPSSDPSANLAASSMSSPQPSNSGTNSPYVDRSSPARYDYDGNFSRSDTEPAPQYPLPKLFAPPYQPTTSAGSSLPKPSPTPSNESGASLFSETTYSDDRQMTSMLDNPNRSLIVHEDPSCHIESQSSQQHYAYPPPPETNVLGLMPEPLAPRPIRDLSYPVPILGQHRLNPYSPRPARWKYPEQNESRPLLGSTLTDGRGHWSGYN